MHANILLFLQKYGVIKHVAHVYSSGLLSSILAAGLKHALQATGHMSTCKKFVSFLQWQSPKKVFSTFSSVIRKGKSWNDVRHASLPSHAPFLEPVEFRAYHGRPSQAMPSRGALSSHLQRTILDAITLILAAYGKLFCNLVLC